MKILLSLTRQRRQVSVSQNRLKTVAGVHLLLPRISAALHRNDLHLKGTGATVTKILMTLLLRLLRNGLPYVTQLLIQLTKPDLY